MIRSSTPNVSQQKGFGALFPHPTVAHINTTRATTGDRAVPLKVEITGSNPVCATK